MMKDLVLPGLDGHSAEDATLYLLFGLVKSMRPSLIVEAGTYMGHATTIMAAAMREAGIDGELWSADPMDYGALKVVEQNGLTDFVHLYRGDFNEMLEGPLKDRSFRMAFIDSGPSSTFQTADDIRHHHCEAARKRLKAGGLMIVDDASGQWVGVEEIRDQASLYLAPGRGLALIQNG